MCAAPTYTVDVGKPGYLCGSGLINSFPLSLCRFRSTSLDDVSVCGFVCIADAASFVSSFRVQLFSLWHNILTTKTWRGVKSPVKQKIEKCTHIVPIEYFPDTYIRYRWFFCTLKKSNQIIYAHQTDSPFATQTSTNPKPQIDDSAAESHNRPAQIWLIS